MVSVTGQAEFGAVAPEFGAVAPEFGAVTEAPHAARGNVTRLMRIVARIMTFLRFHL
jgi:hypothetical protein